jgi:thiol-disulfide isomerase/thioredoxin
MKRLMIFNILLLFLLFCTVINSQEVKQPPTYKNDDIIIFQYSTSWCPPCKQLKNLVLGNKDMGIRADKDISTAIKDNTRGYFYIDIENPKNKIEKNWIKTVPIGSIPLVVKYTYKDGKWIIVEKFTGYRDKSFMLKWIKKKKELVPTPSKVFGQWAGRWI